MSNKDNLGAVTDILCARIALFTTVTSHTRSMIVPPEGGRPSVDLPSPVLPMDVLRRTSSVMVFARFDVLETEAPLIKDTTLCCASRPYLLHVLEGVKMDLHHSEGPPSSR